jgi:hypothetical protein
MGLANGWLYAQQSLLLVGGVVNVDRDRHSAPPASRNLLAPGVHVAICPKSRLQPVHEPAHLIPVPSAQVSISMTGN